MRLLNLIQMRGFCLLAFFALLQADIRGHCVYFPLCHHPNSLIEYFVNLAFLAEERKVQIEKLAAGFHPVLALRLYPFGFEGFPKQFLKRAFVKDVIDFLRLLEPQERSGDEKNSAQTTAANRLRQQAQGMKFDFVVFALRFRITLKVRKEFAAWHAPSRLTSPNQRTEKAWSPKILV